MSENNDLFKETLIEASTEIDIGLTEKQIVKFKNFSDFLIEKNKVMNLTAITEPKEIALKHFVDSLAILKYCNLKENSKIADVGCGAGFPGHPLKIVRQDLELTSIDSLQKRLTFLAELEEKLQMKNCSEVHLRAEEAGANKEYREKFDYSFARAVAKLRVLAEYCLPLVKVGGEFIAMKGSECDEEIEESKNAIKLLGGNIEKVIEYNLPTTDNKRTIVIIKKIQQSSLKYPRINGKISKSPL